MILAGGDTWCMHEYITAAVVIIPSKTTGFGTCALLPPRLLCSYCQCGSIKSAFKMSVSCKGFYTDETIPHAQERYYLFVRLDEGSLHQITFKKLKQAGSGISTTLTLLFYKYISEPKTALEAQ